jgi:regulator of protease activity HflC (stomatin/prohibitin superfamily)
MHALDWFGWLMESILRVVPRLRHIKSTHGGVLFWLSKAYRLKSGLHVYWPVCSDIAEISLTRRTHNLTYQNVICMDGAQAVVAVTVVYQVTDALRALTTTDDLSDTISDLAARAIIDICNDITSEELIKRRLANGKKLSILLRRLMTKDLAEHGVKVRRAFLCEVAIPRTIRLISNHGVFN